MWKTVVKVGKSVPSFPPVALGRRAAEESAGFLGTFGTLKAAWAEEERFPSTLSSSSKLRSSRGKRMILAMPLSMADRLMLDSGYIFYFTRYLNYILKTIIINKKYDIQWKMNNPTFSLERKHLHVSTTACLHPAAFFAEVKKTRGEFKTIKRRKQTHTWQNNWQAPKGESVELRTDRMVLIPTIRLHECRRQTGAETWDTLWTAAQRLPRISRWRHLQLTHKHTHTALSAGVWLPGHCQSHSPTFYLKSFLLFAEHAQTSWPCA